MSAGFANAWFLLLLPPVIAAGIWVYRKRRSHSLVFSSLSLIPSTRYSWRRIAILLLPALFLAGLTLMIFALARPRATTARISRTRDVVAIYMVADTSGSMEALDMSTIKGNRIIEERTRLDAVKKQFINFIERRPDDLIGLITFSGYAYTRAPLTVDHTAVTRILEEVKLPEETLDRSGRVLNQEDFMTAIGDALATACARMKDVDVASRIIVLLSDGESNTGMIDPETATNLAKSMDIRVYTIGIGAAGENVPVLRTDHFGRKVIARARYNMDEEQLRRIAQETGGRYFNAQDANGLERAIETIDELEKTTVEEDYFEEYDEWFMRLLWPGILLAFSALIIHALITRHVI